MSAHRPHETKTAKELFAELLERASQKLRAEGSRAAHVVFEHWHEGETRRYIGRLRLDDGEQGHRLWVYHERDGEFVCRSLVGNYCEAEVTDELLRRYADGLCPPDEIERSCWAQGRASC